MMWQGSARLIHHAHGGAHLQRLSPLLDSEIIGCTAWGGLQSGVGGDRALLLCDMWGEARTPGGRLRSDGTIQHCWDMGARRMRSGGWWRKPLACGHAADGGAGASGVVFGRPRRGK